MQKRWFDSARALLFPFFPFSLSTFTPFRVFALLPFLSLPFPSILFPSSFPPVFTWILANAPAGANTNAAGAPVQCSTETVRLRLTHRAQTLSHNRPFGPDRPLLGQPRETQGREGDSRRESLEQNRKTGVGLVDIVDMGGDGAPPSQLVQRRSEHGMT